MLKLKALIGSLLMVTILTGCAGAGPKQTGGQLLGGAAGAVLGSQFGKGTGRLFGVAIGALAGSYLGGSIGHAMDEKDKQLAQSTMISSLESAPDNQTRTWKNPNNNHSGRFAVTRTEEMPRNHMVCRDYVHTVIIDGQEEKVHGRACRDVRDHKGAWRVVV
jgi:surface antigen